MDRLFGSVPAWRVALSALIATAFAVAPVQAQQPAQPKTTQPKGKAPPPPVAPAAPPPAAAATGPAFVYTPWTKVCVKQGDANAKQICITAKDGWFEDGRLAASAAIIEPEGEPRKLLKIMLLPLGLQIAPGTRVSVDQGQPMSGPYVACFINGCFADYEATADLVGRMKQGQNLVIQGVSVNNQVITVSLPLADLAKAYDEPPLDAAAAEEARKKFQSDMEKKILEYQKKNPPPAPAKAQ